MDSVIKAENLEKEVATAESRFQIFSEISLQLEAAQSLAVVGASGSGKSTLLGLLAGLDLPTSGHVRLLGQNLSELDEDGRARLRAGKVGFVFQSFHLLPSLTALDNVMMPMELLSLDDARARAEAALSDVGLDKRMNHYPAQLSGGEQQRVALARAFVLQPEILFADEPTGNLDHATGRMVSDLMFDLVDKHQTAIVLATHDDALSQRCNRIMELE
ncbi:MAG TPA: ATP-binding cassette domain-containing protein [Gammaproteobacteria bacterium]